MIPLHPLNMAPRGPLAGDQESKSSEARLIAKIREIRDTILKLKRELDGEFESRKTYEEVKPKFKQWKQLYAELQSRYKEYDPTATENDCDVVQKLLAPKETIESIGMTACRYVQGSFKIRSEHRRLEESLKSDTYVIEQSRGKTILKLRVAGKPLFLMVFQEDNTPADIGLLRRYLENNCALLAKMLDRSFDVTSRVEDDSDQVLHFLPIYTIEQLEELLRTEDFYKVSYHLVNLSAEPLRSSLMHLYSFHLYEALFSDRKRFSTSECESYFLKCHDYFPELAKDFLEQCTFESYEFCQAALSFAARHNNQRVMNQILKCHPSIKIDSGTIENLHICIKSNLVHAVRGYLAFGVCPNTPVRKFDFHRYHQEQTALGALLDSVPDGLKMSDPMAKELIELLNLLISHKVDVNQRVSSDCFTEYECSALEFTYYNRHGSPEVFPFLFGMLLTAGARISQRLASTMLIDMKASRRTGEGRYNNVLYFKHLVAQNYLTQDTEEYYTGESTKQNYLRRNINALIMQAKLFIEEAKTYKILHLNQVDLRDISEIRLLKKEMKQRLAASRLRNKELKKVYEDLVKAYDTVVSNHLLLSELRSISKEIRSHTDPNDPPSDRIRKFYGLWSPDSSFINEDIKKRAIYNLASEKRKEYWDHMRCRIISIAVRVLQDRYLSRHFITWVHGTQSKSLPAIMKLGALVPMGELLAKNVVTFSGELCGTDSGLNQNKLSGERLASSWVDGKGLYYDAITRLHTAYIYATQSRGYRPREKSFKPEMAWERATTKHVESLLKSDIESEIGKHGLWTTLRVDIMRLRATDSQADGKLKELKAFVEGKLKECVEAADKEELESILKALTDTLGIFFSPEDMKLISDPEPFPIIFASTTEYSKPHSTSFEHNITGSVELGSKIQIAFTSADKVDELRKLCEPFNIRVYDFEIAFFLEMMNMIRGSRHQMRGQESLQRRISLALQQDILPGYATPFPENPTYRQGGIKRAIPNPFYGANVNSYAEYREKIKSGTLLPRNIHGPMHAVLITIWAQLILNLLKQKKVAAAEQVDPYLIALAAAAHDWSRQDEGKDYWDHSSAKWLRGYFINRDVGSERNVDTYVQALAQKDPENHVFTFIEQMIVHDADCLEIMRCLDDPKDFKKEELCFYNDLKKMRRGVNLDLLIEEIREFISLINTDALKMKLESESTDYYGDVMRYLGKVHDETRRFTNICSLLKKELLANLEVKESAYDNPRNGN